MNETSRPMLAQPREMARGGNKNRLFDMVSDRTNFDVDVWHVMDKRDDALIEDEILNGAQSSKFLYVMEGMKGDDGKPVSGVSVIGARHLAAAYGGIKHRIVASVQKTGSLHVFKSYPSQYQPMHVTAESIFSLSDEPDYYEVLIEITDVKTGNSLMVEKREERFGRRRDGSTFDRPNYAVIAQSKAFRNGVLAIVPQDILVRWKLELLKLDKNKDLIIDGVRDEKIAGMIAFAVKNSLPIDRQRVDELTLDQISGLQSAAMQSLPAFVNAATVVGLLVPALEDGAGTVAAKSSAKATQTQKKSAAPQGNAMPQTDPNDPGPTDMRGAPAAQSGHDPETGEVDKAPTRATRTSNAAPPEDIFQ
jgi:hypothetical protein